MLRVTKAHPSRCSPPHTSATNVCFYCHSLYDALLRVNWLVNVRALREIPCWEEDVDEDEATNKGQGEKYETQVRDTST